MTHDASHSYTGACPERSRRDAENRLTQVDGGSTATYTYDAQGRRISKVVGGVETDYLYDLSGHVVQAYGGGCGSTCLNTAFMYSNGQLLAEYTSGTTYFVSADHLGSTRLLTNLSGGVVDNMDYLPFGEQVAGGSASTHKFTGYERDAESNLDNAQARYNSSSLGRFMSPDPVGNVVADSRNPQSWNMYTYVRNNPLAFNDASGMVVHGINEPLGLGDSGVGDLGGGCMADGIESSCSMNDAMLQGGGAVQCPNNECTGIDLTTNLPIDFVATTNGSYYQCQSAGTWGSQQAAGIAAVTCLTGVSTATNWEWFGNIYKTGGKYSFTLGNTIESSTESLIDPSNIPDGTYAGFYHTHPDQSDYSAQFSGPDLFIAESPANGAYPTYLGTPGRILMYDPFDPFFQNGCVLAGSPVPNLGGNTPVPPCPR